MMFGIYKYHRSGIKITTRLFARERECYYAYD